MLVDVRLNGTGDCRDFTYCCYYVIISKSVLDVVTVGQQNGGGYGRAARGGASDARYQPYSR